MPRRDCHCQLSRWISFTKSKWSSWLRIGRTYWRHSAAIQASLAGIGGSRALQLGTNLRILSYRAGADLQDPAGGQEFGQPALVFRTPPRWCPGSLPILRLNPLELLLHYPTDARALLAEMTQPPCQLHPGLLSGSPSITQFFPDCLTHQLAQGHALFGGPGLGPAENRIWNLGRGLGVFHRPVFMARPAPAGSKTARASAARSSRRCRNTDKNVCATCHRHSCRSVAGLGCHPGPHTPDGALEIIAQLINPKPHDVPARVAQAAGTDLVAAA